MEKCFEVMTTNWLNRAHMYNGSIGPALNSFNYRMEMDEKERVIRAATYTKLCYEKADDVVSKSFTWDDQGVEEMKEWLQSRYEAFQKSEAAPE